MFSATAAIEPDQTATWFDTPDQGGLSRLFAQLVSRKAEEFSRSGEIVPTRTAYLADPSVMDEMAEICSKQEIDALLDQIQTCCEPELGNSLASRLCFLREVLEEEQGPEVDISPESLRGLLLFLPRLGRVKQPEISLTPELDVYLRWKLDTSRLFAVHFLGHRKVRFVVFTPNSRHAGIVDRISGTATVDTVLDMADRSCSVRDWIGS
ncbi:MAG: hypothetical protein U5L00_07420 [Desulfovermiculus sp.]|nr:hypothetical protein [Desulfovermiculus sp.]